MYCLLYTRDFRVFLLLGGRRARTFNVPFFFPFFSNFLYLVRRMQYFFVDIYVHMLMTR